MNKKFELISERFVDHLKVNRVFVLGSANGSGNLGDEAMFEALTGYYNAKYPNIKITTDVTRFPFESIYKNVDRMIPMYSSVQSYRTHIKLIELYGLKYFGKTFYTLWSRLYRKTELKRYFKEFQECDYVMFSGAGAINSGFRSYGIFGWGSLVYLAKMLNKKVFFSGHGIGPFTAKWHERCVTSFLRDSDYVKCRDEISCNLLQQNGLGNVSWTIDDAYFIKQLNKSEVTKLLDIHGVKGNYVVLSFHRWNGYFNYASFKTIADWILNNTDNSIILLGNKIKPTMNDIPVLEKFKEEYYKNEDKVVVLSPPYTPQTSKGVISLSRFLVTTRYHPAIFSGEPNIPCVALSFDDYYYQKFVGALAGRENVLNLRLDDNSHENLVLIRDFVKGHVN